MTVKSPFYNKPSTATSVDSCHKCPSIPPDTQDSTTVSMQDSTENNMTVDQSLNQSAGSEPMDVAYDTSNSNDTTVAGPCSSSAATTENGSMSTATWCSNCGTTTTPLWRRSPQGETICNACGLYLKARNTTRPPWLKRHAKTRALAPLAPAPRHILPLTKVAPSPLMAPVTPTILPMHPLHHDYEKGAHSDNKNASSMACFNCNATSTPLWRRDSHGNTICNACGLYFKLHNVHRPITMKRSVIQRRKRVHAAMPSRVPFYYHQPSPPSSTWNSDDDEASELSSARVHSKLPLKERRILPQTNDKVKFLDAVEPDAFSRSSLPSPPLYPCSTKLANLAKPPSTLPLLPPMALPDVRREATPPTEKSTVNAAAALAAVSAILDPTASPEKMQQLLEAHRSELQREVSSLTTMLSRTTNMLQNLDQAMAMQDATKGKVSDALTLLSLSSAKE